MPMLVDQRGVSEHPLWGCKLPRCCICRTQCLKSSGADSARRIKPSIRSVHGLWCCMLGPTQPHGRAIGGLRHHHALAVGWAQRPAGFWGQQRDVTHQQTVWGGYLGFCQCAVVAALGPRCSHQARMASGGPREASAACMHCATAWWGPCNCVSKPVVLFATELHKQRGQSNYLRFVATMGI